MNSVTVASVQFDGLPGHVDANLRRMVQLIDDAAARGAELVAFPEVAVSDYFGTDFASLASSVPGEQSTVLARAAARCGVFVAAGLIEKSPRGLHNTVVLIDPDGALAGMCRKTHLSLNHYDPAIAREADVLVPGDDMPVFDTPFARVGIMICKDGDYPEVPRILAVKGAEIILWLTNRPGVKRGSAAYHAASNCAAVAVANRAQGHARGGHSAIFDWKGNVVAEAGAGESIIRAELDMAAMREARAVHWNEQRVRRPELYAVLSAS
ncbi:MAG: carbon-nitrogen hydrolase family protein [Spirochaetaceae bacterium]|nr:carbon-nitrogen hydrolase family protein [Spirochaetaceae bacterium]